MLLAVLAGFTACGGGGMSPAADLYYTVTFDTSGGTPVEPLIVPIGSKLTVPDGIKKSTLALKGWYKDREFEEPWDFDVDIVTGDITLYALWGSAKSRGGGGGGTGSNSTTTTTTTTPTQPSVTYKEHTYDNHSVIITFIDDSSGGGGSTKTKPKNGDRYKIIVDGVVTEGTVDVDPSGDLHFNPDDPSDPPFDGHYDEGSGSVEIPHLPNPDPGGPSELEIVGATPSGSNPPPPTEFKDFLISAVLPIPAGTGNFENKFATTQGSPGSRPVSFQEGYYGYAKPASPTYVSDLIGNIIEGQWVYGTWKTGSAEPDYVDLSVNDGGVDIGDPTNASIPSNPGSTKTFFICSPESSTLADPGAVPPIPAKSVAYFQIILGSGGNPMTVTAMVVLIDPDFEVLEVIIPYYNDGTGNIVLNSGNGYYFYDGTSAKASRRFLAPTYNVVSLDHPTGFVEGGGSDPFFISNDGSDTIIVDSHPSTDPAGSTVGGHDYLNLGYANRIFEKCNPGEHTDYFIFEDTSNFPSTYVDPFDLSDIININGTDYKKETGPGAGILEYYLLNGNYYLASAFNTLTDDGKYIMKEPGGTFHPVAGGTHYDIPGLVITHAEEEFPLIVHDTLNGIDVDVGSVIVKYDRDASNALEYTISYDFKPFFVTLMAGIATSWSFTYDITGTVNGTSIATISGTRIYPLQPPTPIISISAIAVPKDPLKLDVIDDSINIATSFTFTP